MRKLTKLQADAIWNHMAKEPYVAAIIEHEKIPDIGGRIVFRRFAGLGFDDNDDPCDTKKVKKKPNLKADQEKRRKEVAYFLREVANGILYGN